MTDQNPASIPSPAKRTDAFPALMAACEAAEQCIVDLLDVYGRGCSMLVLDEAVKSLRDDALRSIRSAIKRAAED